MSHYSDYIMERTSDHVIERDDGFVHYRYLDDETVYIVDIFVPRHMRGGRIATHLADLVCDEARRRGIKTLIGSVQPSAKGSTESVKVLLGYGMKLHTSSQDAIFFRKDI